MYEIRITNGCNIDYKLDYGCYEAKKDAIKLIKVLEEKHYLELMYPYQPNLEFEIVEHLPSDLKIIIGHYKGIIKKAELERSRKAEEEIVVSEKALRILRETRELFDKFNLEENLTEEKFGDIVEEMWELVKENDLPIDLTYGGYNYNSDGTKEQTNDTTPIHIRESSHYYWSFFYTYGNYNIAKDIANVKKEIEDLGKLIIEEGDYGYYD